MKQYLSDDNPLEIILHPEIMMRVFLALMADIYAKQGNLEGFLDAIIALMILDDHLEKQEVM